MASTSSLLLFILRLLTPISSLISVLSRPISPTYYPFPAVPCIHAARVSLAYRSKVEVLGHKGKMGNGVEIVGFLCMCWGGSFITSFLQGTPPPQLLSIYPFINYVSIHLLLSTLLPTLPSPKLLDTTLPLFDAIARSFPITLAVNTSSTHPNPHISNSLQYQLLLGGLASSGGGILASTLNLWTPDWSFQTPPILRPGSGLMGSLDLWSGSLAAAVYGFLTYSNPAYGPFLEWLEIGKTMEGKGPGPGPVMTPLDARSVVVVLLTVLYGVRAWRTHWVGGERKTEVKVMVPVGGVDVKSGRVGEGGDGEKRASKGGKEL